MLRVKEIIKNVIDGIEHISIIDVNVIVLGIIALVNVFFMGLYWRNLKENKCMPWAIHITNRLYKKDKINYKVKERLAKLYVCDNLREVVKKHYNKQISMIMIIIIGINIVSIMVMKDDTVQSNLIKNQAISRPSYGETEKKVDLNVKFDDKEGNMSVSNVDISIKPNRLSKNEEANLIKDVKEYIRDTVLGSNEKYGYIIKKLNLVSKYKSDKNIKIDWQLDDEGLINSSGDIQYDSANEKDLEKGIDIVIVAKINYFDKQYEYPIYMTVKKEKQKEKDIIISELKASVEKLNNDYSKDGIIVLPTEIGGKKVSYTEEKNNNQITNWIMVIIIGIISIFIIINGKIKDLDREIETKNNVLLMYYSEIINKLQLLLCAGLNITAAWEKICLDYIHNKESIGKVNYAYEEMVYTYRRINMGMPQLEEFKEFGTRIGMPQYIKMSSLILQSIKIGSEDFIDALELEEKFMQSEKKEIYIKQGEKLGAKLLLPMIIMMGITMGLVVVPAFISM